jgi:ribosomal protein S18 acetylase RimI-like enzyme
LITIREAINGDKNEVLGFCANTFSWGDYIEQVWDLWIQDGDGKMLVANAEGKRVGLSHVALCPNSSSIWLEGVRVHPMFRRVKIATALIDEMQRYGIEHGATEALAIVARDNTSSQQMMERSGFSAISEWSYYSTDDRMVGRQTGARVASAGDLDAISKYLESSRIYAKSAEKYVSAWRWYPLDRPTLAGFLNECRVFVSGEPLAGVAVLNTKGYWHRKNVLQVVYLDSEEEQAVQDLLAYVTNLYMDGNYERLQILCPRDEQMDSVIDNFRIKESERFLLYSKVFSG